MTELVLAILGSVTGTVALIVTVLVKVKVKFDVNQWWDTRSERKADELRRKDTRLRHMAQNVCPHVKISLTADSIDWQIVVMFDHESISGMMSECKMCGLRCGRSLAHDLVWQWTDQKGFPLSGIGPELEPLYSTVGSQTKQFQSIVERMGGWND